MRYIRKKMQREDGHRKISRTSKESTVKEEEPRAFSILETIREEDEAEEQFFVFDKSDTGKWVREEAVVDSGAVECVTSKKTMPHLRVEGTPESRRGETWRCA